MGPIKSLWASVQGNPVFMRRVNGWLTILWIIMIPVSVMTGWIHSVAYISALSLWALVSGHWSAWQAARVEVTQQQDADKREAEPLERKVVQELIHETTIGLEAEADRSAGTKKTNATSTTTLNEAMMRDPLGQIADLNRSWYVTDRMHDRRVQV